MAERANAWDFLSHGDAIRVRVARDRTSVVAVATDAALPSQVAHKAHWLAGIYDQSIRRKLGRRVLAQLSPMHLEVAAKCPRSEREQLLRAAASEGLGARELRKLIRTERGEHVQDSGGTIVA